MKDAKQTKENHLQTAKQENAFDKRNQNVFKKRNFYCIKDSGLIYLLALLVPLAVSLVFSYISVAVATNIGLKFPEDSNVLEELFVRYLWFAVVYLLLTQVTFLVIWLSFHGARRISFSATKFSVRKANVWTALLSMLTGVICVLGFVWLMEGCFGKLFSLWGINDGLAFEINSVPRLFLALFVLGIVPAICEELIFRGVIFGGLRKSFGMWTSVVLCGLLFALMHQSVTQLIYPFILGCVLAVVMERTGNILYPILIHMFNNFTTVILTFVFSILKIEDINTVFNVQWWGVLCAILLAALTCGILWLLYHFYLKKFTKLSESNEAKEESQNEDNKNNEHQKGNAKERFQKDDTSFVPTYENSPFMIGKIPLTLLCGLVLACIFVVISFFP